MIYMHKLIQALIISMPYIHVIGPITAPVWYVIKSMYIHNVMIILGREDDLIDRLIN